MSKWMKKASLYVAAIITIIIVMSVTACAPVSSTKKYLVYYTNSDTNINAADDLTYKEYRIDGIENMTTDDLTHVLLNKLFYTDLSEEKAYSAKPQNVEIKDFTIDGDVLTVDFNGEYLNMNNVQEILLRTALVLTMIQQPDVSGVKFTVEGEALKDSDGKKIGVMNANNFVDALLSEEGMLKQETDLTIFFTDETATKLIPAKYHFTIKNINTPMEEYILQQLKAGPAIDSTYRTMAPDVDILKVMTTDGVCYVNFGKNFLEQEQPVSDEVLIYSIVNSLCDLPYVNSVQFLIDSSSDYILHTVIDLSKPFTPNKDLEIKN